MDIFFKQMITIKKDELNDVNECQSDSSVDQSSNFDLKNEIVISNLA
jgi:hypothetical protein